MTHPLTATLEHEDGRVKFYRLNRKIKNGFYWDHVDIRAEHSNMKLKEGWINDLEGSDLIAVSDANTHFERLVFTAVKNSNGEYSRTRVCIGGKQTMMIHGGNAKTMKPVEVYLRILDRINPTTNN